MTATKNHRGETLEMAVKRFANRVGQNVLLGVKHAPIDLIQMWADEMLECIRPVSEEDKMLTKLENSRRMKRSIETTWSKQIARPKVSELTHSQQNFYDPPAREQAFAILPDDLNYCDLVAFLGKRTKVTIEELPW